MALSVLHVGKFFPPHRGGMEVFLADLVKAQHAQGIGATALVHGTPLADDPPWLVRTPVQGHLVYAPIAIGFRAALARAIAQRQPDVLHLHMPNNAVFWALTLPQARAIPWVVHWHSDVVVSTIRRALALAYHVYRPFEQAVLEQASRIVVTSPPYLEASEPLQAWRSKCAVVPLGLDTHPAATPLQHPDQVSPWQTNTLRLLSIGRLTYYKGFETLVKATANLPGVELLIVGDGELRDSLQDLIAANTPPGQTPSIRLMGNVSDVEKNTLLQSCDVFCLASRERTEAFGMVLLEAMLHARPCIVSDLPGSGMPWIVQQAQAGMLAVTEDTASWQRAIQQLHAAPALRAQLGANGQKALHTRFSIDTCARTLLQQYALAMPTRHPNNTSTKDVLIVIPARNEAATIGTMLQQLRATGWHDVVVINDQSTDETAAIALAAGAHVFSPVLPLGAWGAMQTGIRYGLQNGYQCVITMDADGQHEVAEIPILLAMRQQADVVIGSFPERASRVRQIAWHWFRSLAGFDLRDLTSGFRYYNHQAMAVLASEEATLLDYQDLGSLLMVRRAGLHIAEVPVAMNVRSVGQSRIFNSWLSVARYMAATTLLCLSRWRIQRPQATR